jgi:hypothetical protein
VTRESTALRKSDLLALILAHAGLPQKNRRACRSISASGASGAVSASYRWQLLCSCHDTVPHPVHAASPVQIRATTCTDLTITDTRSTVTSASEKPGRWTAAKSHARHDHKGAIRRPHVTPVTHVTTIGLEPFFLSSRPLALGPLARSTWLDVLQPGMNRWWIEIVTSDR